MPLPCLPPGWEAPIPPTQANVQTATPGQPDETSAAGRTAPPRASVTQPPHAEQLPRGENETETEIVSAGAEEPATAGATQRGLTGTQWAGWTLAIWAAGVLTVLTRLCIGLTGLRRLRRDSERVSDRSLVQIVAEAAKRLGVRRGIDLRIAHAEARVTVPVVWGWPRVGRGPTASGPATTSP